jgi:hypothetical protein
MRTESWTPDLGTQKSKVSSSEHFWVRTSIWLQCFQETAEHSRWPQVFLLFGREPKKQGGRRRGTWGTLACFKLEDCSMCIGRRAWAKSKAPEWKEELVRSESQDAVTAAAERTLSRRRRRRKRLPGGSDIWNELCRRAPREKRSGTKCGTRGKPRQSGAPFPAATQLTSYPSGAVAFPWRRRPRGEN